MFSVRIYCQKQYRHLLALVLASSQNMPKLVSFPNTENHVPVFINSVLWTLLYKVIPEEMGKGVASQKRGARGQLPLSPFSMWGEMDQGSLGSVRKLSI